MALTPEGKFLLELYFVEMNQPAAPVITTLIEFCGAEVALTLDDSVVVIPINDDRWRIHRAMQRAVPDLRPPMHASTIIRDDSAEALWVELHYDLADDFALTMTGLSARYESVRWDEGVASVSVDQEGITQSMHIDLRTGVLPAATAVDLSTLIG